MVINLVARSKFLLYDQNFGFIKSKYWLQDQNFNKFQFYLVKICQTLVSVGQNWLKSWFQVCKDGNVDFSGEMC